MGDAGKMGRGQRRTAASPGCGKGLDLIPRAAGAQPSVPSMKPLCLDEYSSCWLLGGVTTMAWRRQKSSWEVARWTGQGVLVQLNRK